MEKIKFYKVAARHALEEGFIDYEKSSRGTKDLVYSIFNADGKYDKLLALLILFREKIPDRMSEAIARKLKPDYDFSQLPFKIKEYKKTERIGKGRMKEVFLLESRDELVPNYALKINYQKKKDTSDYWQFARDAKREYELISNWYKDIPDLIPQEYFLVLENPRNNEPALATIQEYLGNNLRDIFSDFSEKELIELLKNDNNLRTDLDKFVATTQNIYERDEKIVDLSGKGNLYLMERDGKRKLVFLDPSGISSKQRTGEKLLKRNLERLYYLEAALQKSRQRG